MDARGGNTIDSDLLRPQDTSGLVLCSELLRIRRCVSPGVYCSTVRVGRLCNCRVVVANGLCRTFVFHRSALNASPFFHHCYHAAPTKPLRRTIMHHHDETAARALRICVGARTRAYVRGARQSLAQSHPELCENRAGQDEWVRLNLRPARTNSIPGRGLSTDCCRHWLVLLHEGQGSGTVHDADGEVAQPTRQLGSGSQ